MSLLVAGNWKMNGLRSSLTEIEAVKSGMALGLPVEVALFPPATLLQAACAIVSGSGVEIGAQDCHAEARGAFTGDLSAPMLKDTGASAVILGHSERRSAHGETSRMVREKVSAALKAGLRAIVCVGETAGEREAGLAFDVCARQLQESLPAEVEPGNTVIAYEPVWAIGTGVAPTTRDIADMHTALRAHLGKMSTATLRWRILYGGSVTPANAASIFEIPDVDGVLVGGASLNAESFLAIIGAARDAFDRHRS